MSKVAKRVFPNDVRVILGVDRLDYTKGLVARLRALDRFFDEFPQWIGKCTFLQVPTFYLLRSDMHQTMRNMHNIISPFYNLVNPASYIK